MSTRKNWVVVASAEHARFGRDAAFGYMQAGHGKLGPLKRVSPGDMLAYYSPSSVYGVKDELQSFVSIGIVQTGEPYAFDVGKGFVPHRRDVSYLPATETSILPLLDQFDFIENRQRWGHKFRFGLFDINDRDMRIVSQAMSADLIQLE